MSTLPEAHCGRPTCQCEHTACFKGWHDDWDDDRGNVTYPCRNCYPIRHAALTAPTPQERDRRLREQSIHQQWTGA